MYNRHCKWVTRKVAYNRFCTVNVFCVEQRYMEVSMFDMPLLAAVRPDESSNVSNVRVDLYYM